MILEQFVKNNRINPADAIVVKKDSIGLLDHYIIYLGFHYGEHKFIANYTHGTKILSYQEIVGFLREFSPNRIRRFKGNSIQRQAAVARALSRVDQTSYHLILNNCEHYANYVQQGRGYSQQTAILGTGLALTGLVTAATVKNDGARAAGFIMATLGLLTLMIDED